MADRLSGGTYPLMLFSEVITPSAILIALADTQASTPGSGRTISLEQLEKALDYRLWAAPAHGFTAADIGKPLVNTIIFDDTDVTHWPTWVLVGVPDANTIRVCSGGKVQFADTLMEAGYNLVADGPYVYWDASAGEYVATKPSDSLPIFREILCVKSVSSGTVTALVKDWGPPGGAPSVSSYPPLTAAEIVDDLATLIPVEDGTPFRLSLAELKRAIGILDGTGTPEGVVTADVGTFYRRKDGSPGTLLYSKESGSGNTGWVAKL